MQRFAFAPPAESLEYSEETHYNRLFSRRKLRKDRPVGAHVGVLQSVPAPLAASKGRSRPSSPNV